MPDGPDPATRTVTRRAILSTVAAASAFGALSPGVAATGRRTDAGDLTVTDQGRSGDELEYVVKVLCGPAGGEAVAPGEYWTAINVHNPHEEAFQFVWKVAVAGPREPGPVSEFDGTELGPDEALELDCPHLREQAGVDERLLKGFLVVRTVVELDVVAVYTAAGEDGTVRTMDVVDVPPRERRGEPDGDRLPDLVPEVVQCGGEIAVRVTNQGAGPAGPSTTVVDFGQYGTRTAETPALDPGDSTVHGFVPEVGCHDPDCDFTVTVDANGVVDESDEGNNALRDRCLG